jgi:hypothetical protein
MGKDGVILPCFGVLQQKTKVSSPKYQNTKMTGFEIRFNFVRAGILHSTGYFHETLRSKIDPIHDPLILQLDPVKQINNIDKIHFRSRSTL